MIIRKSYQHKIGELGEEKKGTEQENSALLSYTPNPDYLAIRHGEKEIIIRYGWSTHQLLGGMGYHGECLKYGHNKEPKGTVVTLQQE